MRLVGRRRGHHGRRFGEGRGSASEIPEETAGPFPGDGSNGPNALTESGVVRRDITKSFGDASGTAAGVPTTIEMTLLDVAGGGKRARRRRRLPVALRHRRPLLDVRPGDRLRELPARRPGERPRREGRLRELFPAAYSGRWPHIHFEVYESLDAATAAGSKLRTSQIALPKDLCDAVYETDGYEQSASNLAQVSLDTDMVFSDGYASQLASWSGSAGDRIAVKLNVGV